MHSLPHPPPADAAAEVLVVDDDALVRRMLSDAIAGAGHRVEAVPDGAAALALFETRCFDVVVADIHMPGVDGLALLRTLRGRGHGVPVLLMTASPALSSAMEAVDCGAHKYLVKPVLPAVLESAIGEAVAMRRADRRACSSPGTDRSCGASRCKVGAPSHAGFVRALESAWIASQPIVRVSDRALFAYEALVRTREPGLTMPIALLEAAERLALMHDLGRTVRSRIADASASCPPGALLFVNLHALDLQDEQLYDARSSLGSMAPRVVLELTERQSLESVPAVRACAARLRALGYRIAVDDLGAGYAGLSSFALLEPEVIKIDMELVRGVHRAPRQQILVRTITQLAGEMNALVVAEGVETVEERDALLDLGCDLMQGYLFARPSAGFSTPSF